MQNYQGVNINLASQCRISLRAHRTRVSYRESEQRLLHNVDPDHITSNMVNKRCKSKKVTKCCRFNQFLVSTVDFCGYAVGALSFTMCKFCRCHYITIRHSEASYKVFLICVPAFQSILLKYFLPVHWLIHLFFIFVQNFTSNVTGAGECNTCNLMQ